MFTWICPQCGREVPPSYTECPDCAAKTALASNAPPAPGEPTAPPPAYPPPPPPSQAMPLPRPQAAPPPPPTIPPGQPQAPQAPYSPPTGQYYPPQSYSTQQYPPYPQQPYPPQGYPPQYPPPPYPPQQYQPPQYPPQYGPPQYTAPYPPPPQQSYAPPSQPRTETAPPPPPVEPPPYSEPAPRTGGTLFGSAPPEQPVYTPTAPPPPLPPEPSHEPGAPRAGGTLFGPPASAEPVKRKGLPTWLMAVLFAGGGIAAIWGIYSLVGNSHAQKPSTTVESPAAKPGAPTNVWQKYIEVSGVRFVENAKKEPMVKFVLTNHAGQDAEDLTGNVTLWGSTKKSEEDAAGTFSFKADVPANGVKDLEAPLTTKLKVYELPDWQYISTDLQITGPGGSTAAK